jgi:hypothetical protein
MSLSGNSKVIVVTFLRPHPMAIQSPEKKRRVNLCVQQLNLDRRVPRRASVLELPGPAPPKASSSYMWRTCSSQQVVQGPRSRPPRRTAQPIHATEWATHEARSYWTQPCDIALAQHCSRLGMGHARGSRRRANQSKRRRTGKIAVAAGGRRRSSDLFAECGRSRDGPTFGERTTLLEFSEL